MEWNNTDLLRVSIINIEIFPIHVVWSITEHATLDQSAWIYQFKVRAMYVITFTQHLLLFNLWHIVIPNQQHTIIDNLFIWFCLVILDFWTLRKILWLCMPVLGMWLCPGQVTIPKQTQTGNNWWQKLLIYSGMSS